MIFEKYNYLKMFGSKSKKTKKTDNQCWVVIACGKSAKLTKIDEHITPNKLSDQFISSFYLHSNTNDFEKKFYLNKKLLNMNTNDAININDKDVIILQMVRFQKLKLLLKHVIYITTFYYREIPAGISKEIFKFIYGGTEPFKIEIKYTIDKRYVFILYVDRCLIAKTQY